VGRNEVGPGLFVAVTAELDDIAPGILAITHLVRLVRPQLPYLGALFAAGLIYASCQCFYVRIGQAKMKYPGFPILEIVLTADGLRLTKLKKLNTHAVSSLEMCDPKGFEAGAENICHDTGKMTAIFFRLNGCHHDSAIENILIPFHRLIDVGDGDPDMVHCAR
jgi:hypothetical protein